MLSPDFVGFHQHKYSGVNHAFSSGLLTDDVMIFILWGVYVDSLDIYFG